MDQPTRRRKIQVDLVKENGEGRKQCNSVSQDISPYI